MKRLCTQAVLLALSAAVLGCAGWRGPSASSAARGPEPHRDAIALAPPAPAPALFIPGPVPLAPVAPAMAQARIEAPVAAAAPPPPPPTMLTPTSASLTRDIQPPLPTEIAIIPIGVSANPSAHDEAIVAVTPAIDEPLPATLPGLVATEAVAAAPLRSQVNAGIAALSPLRALAKKAADRYAEMNTYVMRMRRREMIGGSAKPEEVILCKIRTAPFSVYMKWIGKESNGREVVFVKGQHEDKIHTLVAAGDVPLVAAGKHMSFAVDSILVRANTRHPITEAGLGSIIERFAHVVEQSEQGDPRAGTLKYLGLIKRPEFEAKGEAVLHVIPPRVDPLLPGGGQRLLFFDAALHLPVLVVTQDEAGREVEYYCHDRFLIPGRLDDADFDPSRWDKSTK